MAILYKTIEKIENDSFMGLLASHGQIPGVVGTPVDPALKANGKVLEVVGTKAKKESFQLRIVRPQSWGRSFVAMERAAFA